VVAALGLLLVAQIVDLRRLGISAAPPPPASVWQTVVSHLPFWARAGRGVRSDPALPGRAAAFLGWRDLSISPIV
jgi:hypothetical protein